MPWKGGGGGGGSLTILDEGVAVGTADTIDIVGADHNAVLTAPGEVTIYSPSLSVVSHYNTSDGTNNCTVGDRATTSRLISDPAPDNNYKIGVWSAGDSANSYNGGTWSYTTTNDCLFEDDTSTIAVTVLDDDDVTPLATHTTAAITGNIDVTVNNIRIRVTGWAVEGGVYYRGTITIDITMSAILANGGRVSIQTAHNTGSGYSKNEGPRFYDAQTNAQAIGNVTIAENTVSSSKYISGLRYYDEGDTFDIAVDDLDYMNDMSYVANFLRFTTASEYGITNFNVSGAGLTGWTNYWNDTNSTYSGTHAIDIDDFRYIGTAANITGQVYDWSAGASDASPNASICIDTYDQESSDLAEYFTDEAYRRLAGYAGTEGLWDSTQDIGAYDGNTGAQVINGILKVGDTNWTTYAPGGVGNPNYSAHSAPKDYYRRFIDSTSSVRGSATLAIQGFTLTDLIASDVEMWIMIPGRFTSACYAHTASLYNFGTFTGNNDPIRLNSSTANSIDITFGGLGLTGAQNYFIIRIVINDAAIEPSSVVVSW
jgi:hypothetical protein